MSQKAEASNPIHNQKHAPAEEGKHDNNEYEEMTKKVLKNPSVISSFSSENLESEAAPKATTQRNSIFFKRKSIKEENLYDQVKTDKKKTVLLKNYTKEVTQDPQKREDYFVLFSFICIYGGTFTIFEEMKHKSKYLEELQYTQENPKELLQRKDYISQVLIAAANQKEDNVIKEIIKNDTIGYIVDIPVILAFVKADLHGLLKSLLKVSENSLKNNLKTLRGLIPINILGQDDPLDQPLTIQKTLKNMGNEEKPPLAPRVMFNSSVMSENEAFLKEDPNRTGVLRDPLSPKFPLTEIMSNRGPPPKSAYGNVVIKVRFENTIPFLKQLNKLDIIDVLIEAFGEKHVNHLNLFIMHDLEKIALKYYKKGSWDLTEAQITTLLNKRMWTFLCNIHDDFEKQFLLADNVFSNIKEMLSEGKILTELVLLFMTLPQNGWRQNQAASLLELAAGLLKEDPEYSRLVHASNPILTCAQLSFILKNLGGRFRFMKNDLVALSQKLQDLALNLQNVYRENNLYALYLTTLPTGLTMLDYIVQMGMKNLVETKFTKGLILEFWNNETLSSGSKKQLSAVYNAVNVHKRFEWKIDFTPKFADSYSCQFASVVNSAKYLLATDLIFLMLLYGIVDDYTYNKINFFRDVVKAPEILDTIPSYLVDVTYPEYPARTVVRLFIMANFWFFFLFRTIHIYKQNLKMKIYSVGYLVTFIFMTLTMLTLAVFPNYDIQIEYQLGLKIILVFTRTSIAYLIGTTILGFNKGGETVTVLATVTASLIFILTMLTVYIIAAAEIMDNFFYDVPLFDSVKESFFSLVEILFGSITFINVQDVASESLYLSVNSFMLVFAFSSTILATFLLIAYLSSIYEAVRRNASYSTSWCQYYFDQIYSGLEFKGYYSFPPILMVLVVPFLFFYGKKTNLFLLKLRFFLVWVPFEILKFLSVNLLYYLPVLYFKNIALIFVGRANVRGPHILHLIAWIFVGGFVILYYVLKDLSVLFKMLRITSPPDEELTIEEYIVPPREKLLHRVTDDNVIYIQRYESLKTGLEAIMAENPQLEAISYLELLNYLMHGWKISNPNAQQSPGLSRDQIPTKNRLATIIRKHAKRLYGSKWLKSIYEAKKKFFRELLDGFLTYKTRSMKVEDATLDPYLVLDMVANISEENVVNLRARQIFAIQMVLLGVQSKDQISIMNKIEELEKKIDQMLKIYYFQYGEGVQKDVKWSRVIDGTRELKSLKRPTQAGTNERRAAVFGTAVT